MSKASLIILAILPNKGCMIKSRLWLGLAALMALYGLLPQSGCSPKASAPPVPVGLPGEAAPEAKTGAERTRGAREMLLQVGGVAIFRNRGESPFFFRTRMRIDADGAPNAYHPEDQGADFLKHAGKPGDWQGLVTDSRGRPVIQGPHDPYPGYYISQTSLFDKTKQRTDPARYVDARLIPYIVLPSEPGLKESGRARLGDFAVVINARNRRMAFAIFADQGPRGKIGEGSIALAELLDIPSSPKTGGADGDIVYVVFPGSGNGQPRTAPEIDREGERAFQQWGGPSRLAACYPEYQWDKHILIPVRLK
jgi:Fungal chitosanase of glycosyl hydrolase group 75